MQNSATAMDVETEKVTGYVVVAIIGFLAGLALGQIGGRPAPGHSRIDWPQADVRPRALQP
jgi:hypothetical protein